MRRDSGAHTKEALIEAAIKLFADRGFEATSVQAIVEGASATKGAFYHHFRSKDDVLIAIHQRFVERQISTLEDIEARQLSSPATLALMIEELIADHDTYGEEIAVFNRERHALRDPAFEPVRELRDRVEHMIDEVIARGIASNEFRALPSPRLLVFAVLGITAWLYQWYTPSGPMPAREIGRLYAILILDGLRGEAPIDVAMLHGDSETFARRIEQMQHLAR